MTDRADKRLVFKRSTTPFLHGRNREPSINGRILK
jgi:hypothetical protein